MRQSILVSLLLCLLLPNLNAMDQVSDRYQLSVNRRDQDSFKIEISKTDQQKKQSGSFIANFGLHSCDDQKGLFAPFDLAQTHFGAQAKADVFLWDIPDFGLLKLHHDGSTFFGHGPNEVPLASDGLELQTSGELFLEALRVSALHLASPKTRLCGTLVTDALSTEHEVHNSGSFSTACLLGDGTFINEGLVEFKGNEHDPALLGIALFQNRSDQHHKAKVTASHLKVRKDNQKIINEENAEFEVSDELIIEENEAQKDAIVQNKGVFKAHSCDVQRHIMNDGFLQADTLDAQKLDNREFGQIRISDQISVGDLLNVGEIDVNKWLTVGTGSNKGSIKGSPVLGLQVDSDLQNYGAIRLQQLAGDGRLFNRKSLLFNDNSRIVVKSLSNYGLLKASSLQLNNTKLCNTLGAILELFEKSRIDNATITNSGRLAIEGDIDFSATTVRNNGEMALRAGALNCDRTPLHNCKAGKWLMEKITSSHPLQMNNERVLELIDSSLDFKHMRNYKELLIRGGTTTFKQLINSGVVKTGLLHLIPTGLLQNMQGGSIEVFEKTIFDHVTVTNDGEQFVMQGDAEFTFARVYNRAPMISRLGSITIANTTLRNLNTGKWLMDRMKSAAPVYMDNEGVLELADSSLDFKCLKNDNELVLHSGSYKVDDFQNKKLQLDGNDWTITNDPAAPMAPTLLLPNPNINEARLGEIQCERDVQYDLPVMPQSLKARDVTLSNKRMQTVAQLQKLAISGKVTAWCNPAAIANGDIKFPKITHLELHVNGALTKLGSLTAPALSLYVQGSFTGGKSNTELATIAGTHGPLKVNADSVDGSFTKFYGKGKTDLESTKGDIKIGAPVHGIDENIKQQFIAGIRSDPWPGNAYWGIPYLHMINYNLNLRNGAYAACDDILTLKAAKKINISYGTLQSALGINLLAPTEISNMAGKVFSNGPINIEADLYNHVRAGLVGTFNFPYTMASWTYYPGSVDATLGSLQRIRFKAKKIYNLAGSIRSAEEIILNGKDVLTPATGYFEEPQHCSAYNCNGALYRTYLAQAPIVQSGKEIRMNLGDFVVTGNWNAPGILVFGRTGLFVNSALARETKNITQPIIVDVTQYMKDEAQRPGFYTLNAQGAVTTEFPFGVPSRPQEGDMVLLENPHYPTPPGWRNIFNPLDPDIDLNLILQRFLSDLAGKTYVGEAKGNRSSRVLWGNANEWREQHGKEIMSQADLQQADQPMLLFQIALNGMTPEQRTLFCIPPQGVNPYQSPGDIVTNRFVCVTEGDQTHVGDRVVALGEDGITVESQTGNVHLQTQSHTVQHGDGDGGWGTEELACSQQQFLAPQGPVNVIADRNLTRIGTAIVAGSNVHEQARTGAATNQPLVLKKIVEKTETEDGWFSSTTKVTTNVSHSALPSTTIAGNNIHHQAGSSIHAVATQEVACHEIIYESPSTVVEGEILADSCSMKSETSGCFSDQSQSEYKETPFAITASMRAPLVQFVGDAARINANIIARELHDNTVQGAQFVKLVKEMLYSQQTLVDSPLMSMDAGCKGGYETMIPPMLLVERIIRISPIGQMLFESAIIDKDKTEIIGKFVETTYQLKKWHEEWCHKDQLVSDEMLVVIAAAIMFATEGMGAELLAPLLESATATAMVNAGFSTICATAGTSFLRTGDPLQTIEQIVSPQFLKTLAIDVASAGLCSKLGGMLNVNMASGAKPLISHVQEHALRTTVDTLLNVAINNAPVGKALGNACAQVSLKAVAGYVSNSICSAHLDKIGQQVAHTTLGGAVGFATQGNSKGFASGAVGALTAQTVGDILTSDAYAVSDASIARLKKEGKELNPENIQKAVQEEVNYRMKIAKVASGAVAVMAKLNPSIAMQTAANVTDNDMAIRAQIYAISEMQSLLTAASQAVANLNVHEVVEVNRSAQESKTAGKKRERTVIKTSKASSNEERRQSDLVHNLVLRTIKNRAHPYSYNDLIMECAHEWNPHDDIQEKKEKRTLFDRIVNPEMHPVIKETSKIIEAAWKDAINKTINTYAMVPNPVGLACFAAETGRDIYQERTTIGDVAFNMAATYVGLKGLLWTGKLGKKVYDHALNKMHQRRYASEGIVPFVPNPRAGTWSKEITISGDVMLHDEGTFQYLIARHSKWNKDPKGPFNVMGHGNASGVEVECVAGYHRHALSKANRKILKKEGKVFLNAPQLARFIYTHPEYRGQHINLFVCEAGAKRKGIAQQLSKRMRVPVSAPTQDIAMVHLFNPYIEICSPTGKWGILKNFYPESGSALKATLGTGGGIKKVYNYVQSKLRRTTPELHVPSVENSLVGKSNATMPETDIVLNRLYQGKSAERRISFVKDSLAGEWSSAAMSGDIVLADKGAVTYELALDYWRTNPAAPFNVVAHGKPYSVTLDVQSIHPKALSQKNLEILMKKGRVTLNAVQLARVIRTAPGYNKGQHIHIFACRAGARADGIAQKLSTRMKVPVSAFTESVLLTADGVFKTETKKFSVMKGFYPKLGTIKTFYPESGSALKATLGTGGGIKKLYNIAKSLKRSTPEVHAPFVENSLIGKAASEAGSVLSKAHHKRYTAEEQISFVTDSLVGKWSGGRMSGDLVLGSDAFNIAYEQSTRYGMEINPAAPFNVVGHGNSAIMALETQTIHPKALSQANLRILKEKGEVILNAVQLARIIRTAPGYKKGQHIHLFSCETGARADGIAQRLATRMGVEVSAFTENVHVFKDKPLFAAYCKETEKIGAVKTFFPQSGVSKAVASSILLAGCDSGTEKPVNTYDDLMKSYKEEHQRSLFDRIVNPEMSPFIKESSEIIHAAISKLFNILNNVPADTRRRIPFVEDGKRGTWKEACISGDLILSKRKVQETESYLRVKKNWNIDPRCPFNVVGHGDPFHVQIDTKEVHPHGLDGLGAIKEAQLRIVGTAQLNAKELKQLIETAPGYKPGQPVNLFSCQCGEHSEGIAQELADEMEVPVSACTGNIVTYYNDRMSNAFFTAGDPEKGFKEIKTFYPRDRQQRRVSNIH